MAHVRADRVKETTTTTGTGNVTLAGAVTGYRAFSAVCADADEFLYVIEGGAEWEVGIGTYVSATPAVARGTVLASSNAGALVNFSAGSKNVFIAQPADRMLLPSLSSDPAAPASGAFVYTKADGTRELPRWIGPSGVDTAIQPALFGNSITMWLPGTGTTAAISFGVSWTVGATQAHPAIADTNVMTRMKRATYTTSTTAGNASGVRASSAVVINRVGFYFRARFGILTYSSTMQVWVGLSAQSGILAGDPSAVNNTVCMSKDTGETTWQVLTRDTTAASKTSTGRTTAAAGNAEVFDFTAFRAPGTAKSIGVRVVDIATGTVVLADTVKASNLPQDAALLYPHAECRNVSGGAGTAVAMFLAKMYIETDI